MLEQGKPVQRRLGINGRLTQLNPLFLVCFIGTK